MLKINQTVPRQNKVLSLSKKRHESSYSVERNYSEFPWENPKKKIK